MDKFEYTLMRNTIHSAEDPVEATVEFLKNSYTGNTPAAPFVYKALMNLENPDEAIDALMDMECNRLFGPADG